jgi:CO/xanthine dehydrogenase FAD-binding subunit
MPRISEYHRPSNLDEALDLLHREGVTTVVLAGGTTLNTFDFQAATEVVDIQRVVGASMRREGGRLLIGAGVRLMDFIESGITPPLLAELARREGPNTLRNAATVGGTLAAADRESELVAGFLVHDAEVVVAERADTSLLPLANLLADRSLLQGAIITEVSVAIGGETASARTGRSPADTSIVAAAGRVVPDGFRIALTGVADTPILVDPDGLNNLNPPGDFRGTSEYRRELAQILTRRVMAQLGGAT